jgi:hypothetical protein
VVELGENIEGTSSNTFGRDYLLAFVGHSSAYSVGWS